MSTQQEVFWPMRHSELDDFPFVESQGVFQIRVNHADPFGDLINTVLERRGDARRYVCVFIEDGICAEGACTIQEARDMVDRLVVDEETGAFIDPMNAQSKEEKLFETLDGLLPVMTEDEVAEYVSRNNWYQQAKRDFLASQN